MHALPRPPLQGLVLPRVVAEQQFGLLLLPLLPLLLPLPRSPRLLLVPLLLLALPVVLPPPVGQRLLLPPPPRPAAAPGLQSRCAQQCGHHQLGSPDQCTCTGWQGGGESDLELASAGGHVGAFIAGSR